MTSTPPLSPSRPPWVARTASRRRRLRPTRGFSNSPTTTTNASNRRDRARPSTTTATATVTVHLPLRPRKVRWIDRRCGVGVRVSVAGDVARDFAPTFVGVAPEAISRVQVHVPPPVAILGRRRAGTPRGRFRAETLAVSVALALARATFTCPPPRGERRIHHRKQRARASRTDGVVARRRSSGFTRSDAEETPHRRVVAAAVAVSLGGARAPRRTSFAARTRADATRRDARAVPVETRAFRFRFGFGGRFESRVLARAGPIRVWRAVRVTRTRASSVPIRVWRAVRVTRTRASSVPIRVWRAVRVTRTRPRRRSQCRRRTRRLRPRRFASRAHRRVRERRRDESRDESRGGSHAGPARAGVVARGFPRRYPASGTRPGTRARGDDSRARVGGSRRRPSKRARVRVRVRFESGSGSGSSFFGTSPARPVPTSSPSRRVSFAPAPAPAPAYAFSSPPTRAIRAAARLERDGDLDDFGSTFTPPRTPDSAAPAASAAGSAAKAAAAAARRRSAFAAAVTRDATSPPSPRASTSPRSDAPNSPSRRRSRDPPVAGSGPKTTLETTEFVSLLEEDAATARAARELRDISAALGEPIDEGGPATRRANWRRRRVARRPPRARVAADEARRRRRDAAHARKAEYRDAARGFDPGARRRRRLPSFVRSRAWRRRASRLAAESARRNGSRRDARDDARNVWWNSASFVGATWRRRGWARASWRRRARRRRRGERALCVSPRGAKTPSARVDPIARRDWTPIGDDARRFERGPHTRARFDSANVRWWSANVEHVATRSSRGEPSRRRRRFATNDSLDAAFARGEPRRSSRRNARASPTTPSERVAANASRGRSTRGRRLRVGAPRSRATRFASWRRRFAFDARCRRGDDAAPRGALAAWRDAVRDAHVTALGHWAYRTASRAIRGWWATAASGRRVRARRRTADAFSRVVAHQNAIAAAVAAGVSRDAFVQRGTLTPEPLRRRGLDRRGARSGHRPGHRRDETDPGTDPGTGTSRFRSSSSSSSSSGSGALARRARELARAADRAVAFVREDPTTPRKTAERVGASAFMRKPAEGAMSARGLVR